MKRQGMGIMVTNTEKQPVNNVRNNQGQRNNRGPQLTQEQRTENKKKTIVELIDKNPINTKLVTTELSGSKRLAYAIDEIESGEREVRLKMGSDRLSWESAQIILESISWAQEKVEFAVGILNSHGYGTYRRVNESRDEAQDLTKKLKSTGVDPLSVALRQRAELVVGHQNALIITMKARIEEDRNAELAFEKSLELVNAAITTLRTSQADEYKATKEAEAKEKKIAHEKRVKEIADKKEKEKAEKQAAHEARMKEQQDAKTKKLAEAVNQPSDETITEDKKTAKSA